MVELHESQTTFFIRGKNFCLGKCHIIVKTNIGELIRMNTLPVKAKAVLARFYAFLKAVIPSIDANNVTFYFFVGDLLTKYDTRVLIDIAIKEDIWIDLKAIRMILDSIEYLADELFATDNIWLEAYGEDEEEAYLLFKLTTTASSTIAEIVHFAAREKKKEEEV